MKFRVLKSTLAVILSSSMLMCAIPSVNVSAQTKTIVSSNFNNGNTGWGSFKQSGGDYTLTNQNGNEPSGSSIREKSSFPPCE